MALCQHRHAFLNQGRYIEETIRSVLLQGYPNIEYIVIDGGSTDNTVDVIRNTNNSFHWVSERIGCPRH
jgi:glycosyltransferase involved in cell wall biosynthesis